MQWWKMWLAAFAFGPLIMLAFAGLGVLNLMFRGIIMFALRPLLPARMTGRDGETEGADKGHS